MKLGDKGPEVKEFQKALIALGYPLPRWGADGAYGAESHNMSDLFADSIGMPFDEDQGYLPDIVRFAALELAKDAPEEDNDGMPECMVDMREEVVRRRKKRNSRNMKLNPKRAKKGLKKLRIRRKPKIRDISIINSVTIHQTGTNFNGRCPFLLEMHWVIQRNGESQYLNDLSLRVWQAQRIFNSTGVGLEMDGYYSGLGVDEKYFWKPESRPNRVPMTPTDELIESTRQTIEYICEVIGQRGGEIKFIHAHRQTSNQRSSDPGSLLWKAIVEEYAKPVLGLSDGGKNKTFLRGEPVPEAWCPDYIDVPYR